MRDPFAAIEDALHGGIDEPDGTVARIDHSRRIRTGIPEVLLAEGKTDAQLVAACSALLTSSDRAIVSRVDRARIEGVLPSIGTNVRIDATSGAVRTVVLVRDEALPPAPRGFVGILTAGTSDLEAAHEAATLVREMGCRVEIAADVGVAGLHRLVKPLRAMVRDGVDIIIVAAGMDGALPSVVSGLVAVPVIGLPTSVGYGVAAGGRAALMTMLSTCSPGMTVVNIDNGVGAGATAALIARQAHHARD